jgi:salicylate hydroxylase
MPAPEFAGATATRTVIAAASAGCLAIPAVGLWLSPHAHVVHYPVRGDDEIALVVIAREEWRGQGWDTQADRARLMAQLAPFHPSLIEVLGEVASWRKWALYTLPPLPTWTSDRIALLGDAAHPMLPYLAQGGALAMEDALVLAHHVCAAVDIPQALASYAASRRGRASRVQAASRGQGGVYRLAPPISYARDAVLQLVPGTLLMRRLDWLYDWKPPA